MWTFTFTNDLKSHDHDDDVEMMNVDFEGDAIMEEVDFIEEFDDPMDIDDVDDPMDIDEVDDPMEVDEDFMVWQYV